jgi:pyrroline-5-carboxylate reductase
MAHSKPPNATYGFIGLGVMGWGMAKNLRAKIPNSAKLVICELSEKRREQFVAESEDLTEVALSPKAIAEKSVRISYTLKPACIATHISLRTSSLLCFLTAYMCMTFSRTLKVVSYQ